LPGLPAPHSRERFTYDRFRKCAHPSGSKGNPEELVWNTANWEEGVLVDFDEFTRLGDYPELLPFLAKARPLDHTMQSHRIGRPRTDSGAIGGTWSTETGCAYCAFRPRAPANTSHEDQWWYGTNSGAHSPYRCQPFIRFLCEGGGSETPDKIKVFLQGIAMKKLDRY
jgi:hypothetical protein